MEALPKETVGKLINISEEAAKPLGLVILRMNVRGTPSRPVIEIILDGPRLVSIDDCEIVSKALHNAIDENESLVKGNYRLDVLSPGLDEPIVYDYQLERTIGHLIEVKGQTQQIAGLLKEFSADEIILLKKTRDRKKANADKEEIRIKRNEINSIYAKADFGK